MNLVWQNITSQQSRSYICGHCGNAIASKEGYFGNTIDGQYFGFLYLCHYCNQPTYFLLDRISRTTVKQIPGQVFGDAVGHLPASIKNLYDEARSSLTVNASTASILCSRKLLMNIAVSNGAAEGLKFIEYVNYLSDKGFVPPNGKEWVDHIRSKGNEATHEIKIMSRSDAEELITFLEMLLKFIYEFPAQIKSKTQKKP